MQDNGNGSRSDERMDFKRKANKKEKNSFILFAKLFFNIHDHAVL